jgi:hypothetical protein
MTCVVGCNYDKALAYFVHMPLLGNMREDVACIERMLFVGLVLGSAGVAGEVP